MAFWEYISKKPALNGDSESEREREIASILNTRDVDYKEYTRGVMCGMLSATSYRNAIHVAARIVYS